MDKRLEELGKINSISPRTGSDGVFKSTKTIFNQPEFIEWSEKAKYILNRLQPNPLIEEIIQIIDGLNGWKDERDYARIRSKIQLIIDNPDEFLPIEVTTHVSTETSLSKGTDIQTAFEEYQLIKQIGQGGNGRVFSAKDSDGNDVAIKFVERDISKRKYKRLKNEINFCEKNMHKNIIQIIDHGIARFRGKDYVFYVMPLFPVTLEKKIKSGIEPDVAILIFIGIIQGLKFAHDKGIIHRDIKPENILFAGDSDDPVICDFGIAHFSEDELLTAVETKAGEKLANFQYAAPEQKVKGGATSVTARADVYAAGLILNEMFTGDIPQAGGYKTIAEVEPEYAFLDKLFNKLYQQNPDDRLFPADKILNELYALIENSEIEKKKAELEKAIIPDNGDMDFNLNVVRYYYRDNGIVFELDKAFPVEWFSLLVHLDSYTYVMGYEPKRIHGADNEQSLVMPIKGNVDKQLLKQIIETVNEWINQTNINYRNFLKKTAEKKRREEIEARAKEVEEAKKTQEINALLAEL
ncbi:serine/threonine-protein kinase [Ruminococcus difficilis]|uniref:Serine/threonine protein kinase n=1 Tax=Ruminococcus difficilis TaxID=2763069 RepID=A0A934TZE4_9FIRM|nr:serine/threonine-protein kinase [Ruminococcus difficilis]MBK6088290.1 serine/threonine protein kinase [Ruminococcus difficilis]